MSLKKTAIFTYHVPRVPDAFHRPEALIPAHRANICVPNVGKLAYCVMLKVWTLIIIP